MKDEIGPVILDACCVLTLYGSGRMADVVDSLPAPVYVCGYVVREEALTIYDGPPDDVRSETSRVDLHPLEREGLLEIVHLQSSEQRTFVRLARAVDDGEARTMAIAAARGWTVGTDDKRAIKICGSDSVGCPVITTPEFMRHWAEHEAPETDAVTQADWWAHHVNG
jgi:hypothetical protein